MPSLFSPILTVFPERCHFNQSLKNQFSYEQSIIVSSFKGLMTAKCGKWSGKVAYTTKEINSVLKAVSLPQKDDVPRQSYRSWTRDTIPMIKKNGFTKKFDMGWFIQKVGTYADDKMRSRRPILS
jgi:hypothetical protein